MPESAVDRNKTKKLVAERFRDVNNSLTRVEIQINDNTPGSESPGLGVSDLYDAVCSLREIVSILYRTVERLDHA